MVVSYLSVIIFNIGFFLSISFNSQMVVWVIWQWLYKILVSFYGYFIFTTLGILPWACSWQVNVDILDTAFIYDIMCEADTIEPRIRVSEVDKHKDFVGCICHSI